VIVWKPGKDQKVRRFGGLEGRIVALIPVAGGHGLLTGDSNGFVRLWNIENGRQIRQVSLPGIIGALSIGPDETTCSCTLPETAEGLKVVTYKADRSLPDSRP